VADICVESNKSKELKENIVKEAPSTNNPVCRQAGKLQNFGIWDLELDTFLVFGDCYLEFDKGLHHV